MSGRDLEFPEMPVASPSDIDELFGNTHRSTLSLATREDRLTGVWDEDGEDNEDCSNTEESMKFWEDQKQLLLAILRRSSPAESKVRTSAREALKEITTSGEDYCDCGRPAGARGSGSCRSCSMEKVSGRLQQAGFNIAICTSKWRNSPYIPSGEHTFLDVLETSKKGVVRIIIELNFRAEFEMARASENYNALVWQLPEVFIGKVDRLQSVIRLMCSAAKKCMKEQKMHIGPWRKERYMLAKWLGPCKRRALLPALPIGLNSQPRRPTASMLTVDLTEKLPGMHSTPVEVV